MTRHPVPFVATPLCLCALAVLGARPQGQVLHQQKISDTQGGLSLGLPDFAALGLAVVSLGDVDGDGVEDVAAGLYGDPGGGISRGSVLILFLQSDGSIKSHQRIATWREGSPGPWTTSTPSAARSLPRAT